MYWINLARGLCISLPLFAGSSVTNAVEYTADFDMSIGRRCDKARYEWLELHNAGKYNEALNAGQRALRLAKQLHPNGMDTPTVAVAANNLSITYTSLAEYKKALIFARQALEIDKRYPSTGRVAKRLYAVGWLEAKIGDDLSATRNFLEALTLLREDDSLQGRELIPSLERWLKSRGVPLPGTQAVSVAEAEPAFRTAMSSAKPTPKRIPKTQQVVLPAKETGFTVSQLAWGSMACLVGFLIILNLCGVVNFWEWLGRVGDNFQAKHKQWREQKQAKAAEKHALQEKIRHQYAEERERFRRQEAAIKQQEEERRRKQIEAAARPKQPSKSPEQSYALPEWVWLVVFLLLLGGCGVLFSNPQKGPRELNSFNDPQYDYWKGGPY